MDIKIKIKRRSAIRGYHILGGAGFIIAMMSAGYLEASNDFMTIPLVSIIGIIGGVMIFAAMQWEIAERRKMRALIRAHKENIMHLFKEGLNWT